MKRKILAIIVAVTAFVLVPRPDAAERNYPSGTWCIEEGGLVIDFRTGDSLTVESTLDETVNGTGTYVIADTSFIAQVVNGDLALELGYRYRWENDSVITARPMFFIVNGDTLENPSEWMKMSRCRISEEQEK